MHIRLVLFVPFEFVVHDNSVNPSGVGRVTVHVEFHYIFTHIVVDLIFLDIKVFLGSSERYTANSALVMLESVPCYTRVAVKAVNSAKASMFYVVYLREVEAF